MHARLSSIPSLPISLVALGVGIALILSGFVPLAFIGAALVLFAFFLPFLRLDGKASQITSETNAPKADAPSGRQGPPRPPVSDSAPPASLERREERSAGLRQPHHPDGGSGATAASSQERGSSSAS